MRLLQHGDESALSAFLAQTPETAMFLRSNLRASGIVDDGKPYQGSYVGAFEGDKLVGVASFCWNGNLMLQCSSTLAPDLAAAALTAKPDRQVLGVLGPQAPVAAAIDIPEFTKRRARLAARQSILALDLADLPDETPISARVRAVLPKDGDVAAAWRHDYLCETLGAAPGDATRLQAVDEIERATDDARGYVLCMGDHLLAYAGFNATLPDMVQIGGLYCPPEERGLGYGRAALLGALLAVRTKGVAKAVLFTSDDNVPTLRCAQALGFKAAGEYGVVFY
jgi:GNAT superfamily N-acetyltransferase